MSIAPISDTGSSDNFIVRFLFLLCFYIVLFYLFFKANSTRYETIVCTCVYSSSQYKILILILSNVFIFRNFNASIMGERRSIYTVSMTKNLRLLGQSSTKICIFSYHLSEYGLSINSCILYTFLDHLVSYSSSLSPFIRSW